MVMDWLEEAELHWSYTNIKLPCAPTTRFADLVFITIGTWVVILEIDENEHRNYILKCEIARVSELMDSIHARSLHVIRFNPHGKSSKEELLLAIKDAISTDYGVLHDSGCVIQYLGYSQNRIAALEELTCEMQKY